MTVLAIPKEDSYVIEWEALRFTGSDFNALKRLMRNSPWIVQLILDDPLKVSCTQIHHGVVENWMVGEGDWVVRSPHGKYWFMGDAEFNSQFAWRE